MDTIYTRIGSSALVAVNPHEYVSSNANSILQKHAIDHLDTAENKPFLPPHIFSACQQRLLLHAPHRSQDQSLTIRCALFLLSLSRDNQGPTLDEAVEIGVDVDRCIRGTQWFNDLLLCSQDQRCKCHCDHLPRRISASHGPQQLCSCSTGSSLVAFPHAAGGLYLSRSK